MADAPRYSIVIPSWNEAANLPACIRALRAAIQALPEGSPGRDAECILVDNGSTDGTAALARSLELTVLENASGSRMSIAALRNWGAAQARGEILCFLDADMRVPPDWLQAVHRAYEGGFDGMLGFVERAGDASGSGVPWVARIWGERYRLRRQGDVPVDFLPGRNLCVPRALFLRIGGFDETLRTSEDKDLALRALAAGAGVRSSDAVILGHLGYEKGWGEFVRKEFWRQSGSLAFARKQGWRFRVLRQPLMAAGHGFCLLLFLLCLLTDMGSWRGALWVSLIWLAPSAANVLAGPSRRARREPWLAAQLILVMFLRWNVAALALGWQLWQFWRSRLAGEGRGPA